MVYKMLESVVVVVVNILCCRVQTIQVKDQNSGRAQGPKLAETPGFLRNLGNRKASILQKFNTIHGLKGDSQCSGIESALSPAKMETENITLRMGIVGHGEMSNLSSNPFFFKK